MAPKADISLTDTHCPFKYDLAVKTQQQEANMGMANIIETITLLVFCIVLPSGLAMYFSAPPGSGAKSN